MSPALFCAAGAVAMAAALQWQWRPLAVLATALAALLQERDRMKSKRVALILSGANISRALLANVLSQ